MKDRFFGKDSAGFGGRCFLVGLFLLPSSALLAALFLFVACLIGSRGRDQPIWRDPWILPLLLAGMLMLIGCLVSQTGALAWAGLANWLPFLWGFWAFQPYVRSADQRRRSARVLLAGTVPVLITGFGQMLLGWSGPWQLLGGGIIWFVAPGGHPEGRLSGLFDYANVAGAWLAVMWPLSLAAVLRRRDPLWCRAIAMLLASALVAAVVLTRSRNAIAALPLALPWVLGPMQWWWLLPLLILAAMPLALAVLPGVPDAVQQWVRGQLPSGLRQRFVEGQSTDSLTRVAQWRFGVELIAQRPWLGWGAAAFSVLYPIHAQRKWHGHSHNLPLELAVSHGLPVAVLLVGIVLVLIVVALQRGMLRRGPMERGWWTAFLVLVAIHATDLPFFDSRMNILGWVLLSGLHGFIREHCDLQAAPDRDAPADVPG